MTGLPETPQSFKSTFQKATSARMVWPVVMAAVIPVAIVGCFTSSSSTSNPNISVISAYVVLGDNGQPVARAITDQGQCPAILHDNQVDQMDVRMVAGTMPLRTTASAASDSKPSAFPVLTCEKALPMGTAYAQVSGHVLPLPAAQLKRIVVIGDTGCRIKGTAVQACNDPTQYPFAAVAQQAANWKPDLVVHVGDIHYRENQCPTGNTGCQGSPWGYGWDAWNADFFTPAQPLLAAAPWAVARGNHESCYRAGQGWWRFIDPRPVVAGQDCNDPANDTTGDYSDPIAIPLGGDTQLILMDTSNALATATPLSDIRTSKYLDLYKKVDTLTQKATYNIGVNHHPILGIGATQDASGNVSLYTGNLGLQSVFGTLSSTYLPPKVNVMLSGHVHLWEQMSFSTPHPTQIIAGFSGTQEDTTPLPASLPSGFTPAPGAVPNHFSSWVNGFGFMTMERTSMTANQWLVKVWDKQGNQVNTCRINGKDSDCDFAQVK